MRCRSGSAALGGLVLLWATGCGSSARLVRWDHEGGIVAIPNNSNYWPLYHRNKADELMKRKCPQGYEVVREEEVVVGQTAHTDSRTDTDTPPSLLVGGENTTQGKKGEQRSSGAGFAVPLGETRATTRQTTAYSDVTEYRIWFRPK